VFEIYTYVSKQHLNNNLCCFFICKLNFLSDELWAPFCRNVCKYMHLYYSFQVYELMFDISKQIADSIPCWPFHFKGELWGEKPLKHRIQNSYINQVKHLKCRSLTKKYDPNWKSIYVCAILSPLQCFSFIYFAQYKWWFWKKTEREYDLKKCTKAIGPNLYQIEYKS
jgi:hypothetical protein